MNRIELVVSDVDGTLVTPAKRLTKAAIEAVQKLHARNIGFTVTSSRPPFGMRMLVEPLGLKLPLGAFNGSSIVNPALEAIERKLIPYPVAEKSVDLLQKCGVNVWLFTSEQWFVAANDEYVPREKHTIETEPIFASDFSRFTAQACKIVGVSADFDKLVRCEKEVQQALGGSASAIRSQSYYLDITPAGRDKGTFVNDLAARLNIAPSRIATIGDMQNDVAMFSASGLSYAMGNATDDVKARATCVSASNEEDGFAKAIESILAQK